MTLGQYNLNLVSGREVSDEEIKSKQTWRFSQRNAHSILNTFYPDYVEQETSVNSHRVLPYKVYNDIVMSYLEWIMDRIIDDGRFVKLPHFGWMYVLRKRRRIKMVDGMPVSNRKVNMAETRKQGKRVFYDNLDTDNYIFKFRWERPTKSSCNETKYNFKTARRKKERLHAVIVSGKLDYIYSKNRVDDPEFHQRIRDNLESLRRSGLTGDQS